jgi:hypothetical protein
VYDFENIEEEGIDGSNHRKIKVCRFCRATINSTIIKDYRNNVLVFDKNILN